MADEQVTHDGPPRWVAMLWFLAAGAPQAFVWQVQDGALPGARRQIRLAQEMRTGRVDESTLALD